MGPLQSLDNTIGASFLGVIVAACLLGVSFVQAFFYYTRYPDDAIHLKLIVGAVVLFDAVHQALITHTAYVYVITNYNNPSALQYLVWSLLVEVIFNGLTALVVQCFLTLRVWRLSGKNIPLTLVVICLVLAEFGSVVAFFSMSLRLKTYVDLARLKPLSITVNALAAITDALIALSLCTLLHRSKTGFSKSNTMINKLIMFAVNTGFLTSLCAIASLVSIVLAGNTFLYICFFFCLGRLYTNSLLATLNVRQAIRGDSEWSEELSLSMRSLSGNFRTTADNGRSASIAIKVDTTQDYKTDRDRGSSLSRSPTVSTDVKRTVVEEGT